MLPRDLFIHEIYRGVESGKDIYFLSADLGAKALDKFRSDFPERFIHTGICEQNMIDVAAGLAQNGKQVFVYAMGSFITLRCFEQIKVTLSCMNLPVTLIGVGQGYGYCDAGPTHNPVEDIAVLRTLAGIEIYSPGDSDMIQSVARHCIDEPSLRYIRLERGELPSIENSDFNQDGFQTLIEGKEFLLISDSFMLNKAKEVAKRLTNHGHSCTLVDLYRSSPINSEKLLDLIESHSKTAVIEEQFNEGGISSALLEFMNDAGRLKKIIRLGIKKNYIFDNGGRDHLLELSNLGQKEIFDRIMSERLER